jgi:hypothetical protein
MLAAFQATLSGAYQLRSYRLPTPQAQRTRLPCTITDGKDAIYKYVVALGVLPTASYVTLPYLLQQVTNFELSAAERQPYIIGLLLAKRIFLYATALATVELCSLRATETEGGIGERLKSVNSEMFAGLGLAVGESDRRERLEAMKAELDDLDRALESNDATKVVSIDGAMTKKEDLLTRMESLKQANEDNMIAYVSTN